MGVKNLLVPAKLIVLTLWAVQQNLEECYTRSFSSQALSNSSRYSSKLTGNSSYPRYFYLLTPYCNPLPRTCPPDYVIEALIFVPHWGVCQFSTPEPASLAILGSS